MAFNTPFHPENSPGALFEFGWYKIQRHTKAALVDMIGNFFDARAQLYKIQVPNVVGIQNFHDIKNIFISQDFPYGERKLPLIIVAIKGGTERKMYIGADNFLYHDIKQTSTGKTASEVYAGAAEFSIALIVLSRSPEERMRLVEFLNVCFTHYYRWQYFYTYGDGDMFSIVPSIEQLQFGSENEVTDGPSKQSLLYVNDMSMKSFVEYTFRGTDTYGSMEHIHIEEDSGPIIYVSSS